MKISISRYMPTIVAAVVMTFFTVYMFYPGIINADSANQLSQARLFKFADWHPPIMSFLWFLLNHIHDGAPVMLVFHNLVFWFALSLLAFWISPHSNLYRILFLIVFGFFPTVLAQLGTVFKDTAMSFSLFLASVLFLYAGRATIKIKLVIFLVIAIIFLFYGFAVRLNSTPAVIVLCLWFGDIVSKKKFFKSILIGVALFILLFVGKQIITTKVLRPVKTYPFQQVQLHDLTAISLAQKQPIFPGYIIRSPNFNMEKLQSSYTAANVGELIFSNNSVILLTNDKDYIQNLNKVWWHNIRQHPWNYLKHRLNVFTYMISSCVAFWDDVCRVSLYNFQPGFIYNLYCKLSLDGPLKFLFHSWVYIINSVVIAVVAIRLRQKLPDFNAMIYLISSGILYVIGSFFYAPSCEFRYVYWEVLASLFALSLFVKDVILCPGQSGDPRVKPEDDKIIRPEDDKITQAEDDR